MQTLLGTDIAIGDIVQLSPSQMSTIDDLDLEKCTVIELDEEHKRIKVVFNNNTLTNELFFGKHSIIDWFSIDHVIDIERDYKVIEITDNQDTITGQDVCFITMAKMVKKFNQTSQGHTITAIADPLGIDRFILVGFISKSFKGLQNSVNRISFSQYKARYIDTEFAHLKIWQPKNIIEEPEDMFTMLNLKY